MNDPLATYLNDHLAGAMQAVELLERMGKTSGTRPLGEAAAELGAEVELDRDTLKKLVERVGSGPSAAKEWTGWVSEKISRLKFDLSDSLGTFEALEFLSLGIQGKLAMWRVLARLSPRDARLQHLDYPRLIQRAEAQYTRMEDLRMGLAPGALYRSLAATA